MIPDPVIRGNGLAHTVLRAVEDSDPTPPRGIERPTEPSINVTIECTIDYPVREIWPDGDQPAVITAEAVAAEMKADVLGWFAADVKNHSEAFVRVCTPNPAFTQAETLLPDHRPHPVVVTTSRFRL